MTKQVAHNNSVPPLELPEDEMRKMMLLAAGHATDADEARMFLMELGIIESPEPPRVSSHREGESAA